MNEFKKSISNDKPPSGIDKVLEALWQDTKGNWDTAHGIVLAIGSSNAAWVHAYLHRKEGDISNASYWYNRANKPMPQVSLEEEWENIVKVLLELKEE